jgi:uncharacterized protein (TIGR02271 family)
MKIAKPRDIGHIACDLGETDPSVKLNDRGFLMTTTSGKTLRVGMTVFGNDREKIGDIARLGDNHFIIEKGWLFPEDVYVPHAVVASVTDEDVFLTLTKNQVESQDWSVAPTGDAAMGDAVAGYRERTAADPDATLERREERLVVDKDVEQVGSVKVGKRVVEDKQSVDVPVTREDVTVTRRAVDRDTGETLDEAEIEVPIYGERVEAGKQTRVVEELEIDKTPRTDTKRVSETVRREEFDVEEDTRR